MHPDILSTALLLFSYIHLSSDFLLPSFVQSKQILPQPSMFKYGHGKGMEYEWNGHDFTGCFDFHSIKS